MHTSFSCIVLLLLGGALFGLGACAAQGEKEEGREAIVRVHDKYFYRDELNRIIPPTALPKDSTDIATRYLDSWIKKQLLTHEAEKSQNLDEAELERKLAEYRFQLLMHEFTENYVRRNLDTLVTDAEVMRYYVQNKENFQLKQNIAQALFLQLPKNAPKLPELRRWIQSDNVVDQDQFKSYAVAYGERYYIEDSTWVSLKDLLHNTAFPDVPYLEKNKFYEAEDEQSHYLLRIQNVKLTDEVSPLNYVREQIEAILMNKRKVELQNELEEKIYDDAIRNKTYEYFVERG